MGKYIDKKAYSAMVRTESSRRSSESFFSSKEDNDNYFGKVAGQTLRIVGVEPVAAQPKSNIGAYNVVKFDDGHQLSTNKFFSAKGLRWPVGGNVAKLNYICSALENNTTIEVTPIEVVSTPMKRRDGTFVGDGGAVLKAEKEGKIPVGAVMAVTYRFEDYDLPKVEMIDFTAEEEE